MTKTPSRLASVLRRALSPGWAALFLVAAISPAHAALSGADLHLSGPAQSLQFGGFASQGYLKSSANNYLGETSKGTFDFREYAVNTSYALGKWRIGAQAFGQKLGDYGDDKIKLDWASLDYQPAQWFGVRAGRVKMPRGLYNEALDVDSVRPFVLLPQSVYDNRLRDFNASIDGAMVYGNVSIGQAGSIDYRAFDGKKPMNVPSGANDYFNNDGAFRNINIKMDSVRGGTLFWNTPAEGLRLGYSYSAFKNLYSERYATNLVGHGMPEAMLYFSKSTPTYDRHLVSVEFIKGDWVLAAEAGREKAYYDVRLNLLGSHLVYYDSKSEYFYLSAARRINRWLELGTYYSHSFDRQTLIGPLLNPDMLKPDLKQGDFALSAKFDVNDHLLFKVEGHYMDGAGKIFDTLASPQPFAKRDNSWSMLAIKTTYSF